MLKAAQATPKLDPSLAKKCSAALANDATTLPLFVSPTSWGVVKNLQDSGIGTRGIFAWFEPQNAWLSK
jgi:hypothetical protein